MFNQSKNTDNASQFPNNQYSDIGDWEEYTDTTDNTQLTYFKRLSAALWLGISKYTKYGGRSKFEHSLTSHAANTQYRSKHKHHGNSTSQKVIQYPKYTGISSNVFRNQQETRRISRANHIIHSSHNRPKVLWKPKAYKKPRFRQRSRSFEIDQYTSPISKDNEYHYLPAHSERYSALSVNRFDHTANHQFESTQARVYNDPKIPYTLSLYAQFLYNVVICSIFVYFVYHFLSAISADIDKRLESYSSTHLAESNECRRKYFQNNCMPERRVPAVEKFCVEWERCMNRESSAFGRTKAAAETLSEAIDSFISPLSVKTWLILIGSLVISFVFPNALFAFFKSNKPMNFLPFWRTRKQSEHMYSQAQMNTFHHQPSYYDDSHMYAPSANNNMHIVHHSLSTKRIRKTNLSSPADHSRFRRIKAS